LVPGALARGIPPGPTMPAGAPPNNETLVPAADGLPSAWWWGAAIAR